MKKLAYANKSILVCTFCLLFSIVLVGVVRSVALPAHAIGAKGNAKTSQLAGGTTLSVPSGPPGTHVFITSSGFTPGESVQPIWNYNGTGTVIAEKSFYYYNPAALADASGVAHISLFVPSVVAGNYTIASVGAKSSIVDTASFQLTPSLETGVYIGSAGTILSLRGWGFGANDTLSLYWNKTSSNAGTLFAHATTDKNGTFSKRTFTVPAGTPNGVYTLAATGANVQVTGQTQFTVGTPSLNQNTDVHDWPSFGYDLQGTRVNTAETAISTSNASTLAVKWKSAFPVAYKVSASPTVANGIVFVGTIQGSLIAFDAATGKTLWTFAANGPIYGSPAIQNGIAYFGTVSYPGGGAIGNYAYALNATDGSLIWKNYLGYGADWVTPLVYKGVAYFPSAGKEGISGGFSAFNASTGALIWQFSEPSGIWASPTIDPSGNNLYVNTGNPCLGSGGSGCSGSALDLNPSTGAIIWSNHLPDLTGDDDIPTTSTYSNGSIYLGSKNGIFYRLDATNGAITWQYDTGKRGDSGIYSSPAVYADHVFFEGGDSLTHALNTADGSVAWTFKLAAPENFSSPAIANGVLYAGDSKGTAYALNASTGSLLWQFKTNNLILSSPTVSNGVLYVSGCDGYLYAFSPNGN